MILWIYYENISKKIIVLKVLQHPDKKNHGRSKTRNLGIKTASNELIAFLDADDFYLDNRFKNDLKILENRNIDGVYNAIGIHFYDSYKGDTNIPHVLTTLKSKILPEELFERMEPFGSQGWFSGDGFIVKKQCLIDVGMFNEKLIVAEDTELWVKLSLKYNLESGELVEPVAKRGVHDNNIFNKKETYKKPILLMYQSILVWASRNKVKNNRLKIISNKFIEYLTYFVSNNVLLFYKYWFKTIFFVPKLIGFKVYIKSFFKYHIGLLQLLTGKTM